MSKHPYNIAVIGSRQFTDYAFLEAYLNTYCKQFTIPFHFISGGAKGTDTLVERYATAHGYTLQHIIPDWIMYQKLAVRIQNVLIVEKADVVIAFWDGYSKGKQHVIELTKTSGKPLLIIDI